jgi:NitT/TauT family transport system substrate-binding protein
MHPTSPTSRRYQRTLRILFLAPALFLLAACSRDSAPATTDTGSPAPTRVRLQADWYAQAEHGGYYQAVARGFDREAGIQLVITQGGPGSFGPQKVATGQAEFSMGRSDDVMLAVQQGLPIVIVTALMQHDPQALLLHEENPVNSFADLDGKNVMTTPGAAFIQFIQRKYNVRINIIPLNYGLAQFMADKNFIQQCFVTNEPYFVAKNGAKPKTLMIAGSGYDPYRVIFTSRKFARENPAAVQAFVNATARGWHDFLNNDPTPGMALITKDNEKMYADFMQYSIDTMNRLKLVSGDPANGEGIGRLDRKRLEEQAAVLLSTGLLKEPMAVEKFVSFDFPPPQF